MAWSVLIWKIYGFPKVSLYLERFVPKHATAHIQTRCASCKNAHAQTGTFACPNTQADISQAKELFFFASAKRNTIFDKTVKTTKENGIIWAFHQDKKGRFRYAVKEIGCVDGH